MALPTVNCRPQKAVMAAFEKKMGKSQIAPISDRVPLGAKYSARTVP